ncbi:DUF3157 family protein [Moritella sp. F3]|uniref:DUF3157 family protein n=1 Tax=Moritella sp. F3 TaxID=2718882 RepID=UPI0018E137B8|nr:DUF3157 family protein [Moritella sp. F3]GIC79198.1 hypothetical protein FMO001_39250 [Moritella sp. F1]GIC81114.1 hypothetical protein FMO003_13950 [Moritella sp. F3]
MFNKVYIIACSLLFSFNIAAVELTRIVLEDGTEVVLNDDFTWQYVLLSTPDINAESAASTSKSAPKLTPTAMANSALMTTDVSQGVRVTFKSAQWDDEALGLDFSIENNSPLTVLKVTIAATLFDDGGNKITTTEFNVWQATGRLPETYLRKGQQRESRIFQLDDISPAQWQKQFISLDVIAVETR